LEAPPPEPVPLCDDGGVTDGAVRAATAGIKPRWDWKFVVCGNFCMHNAWRKPPHSQAGNAGANHYHQDYAPD
jgi:hypothetical protein